MEETTLAAAVGRKIANLRKERGLTQRQLADKIYTSDKNLSKWETGQGFARFELFIVYMFNPWSADNVLYR